MPWWPPSCVVFTAVTMKSARTPLVMNIFEPLTTKPPSTRLAQVLMPATSEPASGSVIPSAAIFSPLIAGHEVALLLVLGPELPDRRQGDRRVRADARRQRRPSPQRASSSANTASAT